MKIINTTNIPTEKIRELIKFSRPNGISKFDVMIKNLKNGDCRGRAYHSGSSYHFSNDPFIVVSITKSKNKYPTKKIEGKGYLPFIVMSRTEHLLFILAHELRHLWQKRVRKGWRVWGAKGQFSERDADAYAIRKVREWRKVKP